MNLNNETKQTIKHNESKQWKEANETKWNEKLN